MKKLFSVLLLASLSLSSFANEEVFLFSTGTTISPFASTYICLTNQELSDLNREAACSGLSLSLSTTSSIVLLKEEVQQVEPDAYAFLAGEEMSQALEEVVNKAREEATELQEANDKEVVSILLSSIQ